MILITIITIPSILAYTYFVNPTADIIQTNTTQEEIPQVQESDNQIVQNPIEIDEGTGLPARTVDNFTNKNGIEFTVKEVMTEPFDPLKMNSWTIDTAMRAEQILKEETDAKVNKVEEQFTTGGLSSVLSNCNDIEWWYEYYYFGGGRNLDGLWSYNQKISDFFKQKMDQLGCEYFKLPEGNKEILQAQGEQIQKAIQDINDEQQYYDELYGKQSAINNTETKP